MYYLKMIKRRGNLFNTYYLDKNTEPISGKHTFFFLLLQRKLDTYLQKYLPKTYFSCVTVMTYETT